MFRGNGALSPEQADIRQLKEENRRLLKAHGFVGSMSRKSDCWDTQRCGRELLRKFEARASPLAQLLNATRSTTGCAELHIDVLR